MPLEELMITDQFIHGVPEELGIWLRERKPKSTQEAMGMADDYTLARKGNKAMPRKPFSSAGEGMPNESRMEGRATNPMPPATQQRDALPEGRSRTNTKGDKRCFQCVPMWKMGESHVQLSESERERGFWSYESPICKEVEF